MYSNLNFILELKLGFSGTHCPPNLFLFSHIPCINAPESESILILRNYFYSYFVYEETGAQKGQVKLAKVTLLLGTRIITLTFTMKNSCHTAILLFQFKYPNLLLDSIKKKKLHENETKNLF